jgi:nucleoside-diphosphate-sugar epimerase
VRVLVTGATGFFGRRLVADAVAAGHSVVAPVRGTSDTRAIARPGVHIVGYDDLAPDGFDAVVLAAGGGRVRDQAEADATNVTPTARALERIGDRDVPIVYVSSIAAAGPRGPHRAPPDAPDAPSSAYGRSKLRAEALVRARGVVIRVPPLYGPGDDNWAPLVQAARRGFVPILGRDRTTSILHVADLSSLVLRVLEGPRRQNVCWYADDGEVHRWGAIVEALGAAVGRRVWPVTVPPVALPWAAAAVTRLTGRTYLTADKLADAAHPHWVCSLPAPDVDWAPKVGLYAGFAEMAAHSAP